MRSWSGKQDTGKSRRVSKLPLILLLIVTLIGAAVAAGVYWSAENRAQRALEAAHEARTAGRSQEAIDYYEEAQAADPGRLDVLLALAELELAQKRPHASKVWLDEIALLAPLEPAYLDALYDYAMQVEDYPLASSLLNTSEQGAISLEELVDLSQGLLDAQLYSEAEQTIEDGLQHYPDAAGLITTKMELLQRREDSRGIIALYTDYPEVFAEDRPLLEYLKAEFTRRERWSEAAELAKQLLELDGLSEERVQELYLLEANAKQVPGMLAALELLKQQRYAIPMNGPQIIGNTSGNMMNGGFVATEGEKIYYLHYEDHSIRVTDRELASRSILLPEAAAYLNAADGWIYFQNLQRDAALYKIKQDGSGLQRLSQGAADLIGVWGQYVYYRAADAGGQLQRRALDGTRVQSLTDFPVEAWGSNGSTIWLIAEEGLLSFEIADIPALDSSPQAEESYAPMTPLVEGRLSYLNIGENHVYYLRHNDDSGMGRIERLSLDGGETAMLEEDLQASDLNYADNYLYFTNQTLHKLSTTSLVWEKLGVTLTENIQITEDWIFTRSPEDDLPMVRLHLDGSNWGLMDDTLR